MIFSFLFAWRILTFFKSWSSKRCFLHKFSSSSLNIPPPLGQCWMPSHMSASDMQRSGSSLRWNHNYILKALKAFHSKNSPKPKTSMFAFISACFISWHNGNAQLIFRLIWSVHPQNLYSSLKNLHGFIVCLVCIHLTRIKAPRWLMFISKGSLQKKKQTNKNWICLRKKTSEESISCKILFKTGKQLICVKFISTSFLAFRNERWVKTKEIKISTFEP